MPRHRSPELDLFAPHFAPNVKFIPGPLAGELSGSLGNSTFSRNRGGAYIRIRGNPVNPSTPAQNTARANFDAAIQAWTNTLTPAQRDAWDVYAAAVPKTDVLGQQRTITGQNWFVGSAAARLAAGLAIVANGPAVLAEAGTPQGIVIDDAPGGFDLDVAFDNADAWATETGGALLVYQYLPGNASTVQVHNRRAQIGVILGNGTTPPTSPVSFTAAPFIMSTDQAVTVAARAVRADGRISPVVNSAPLLVS